jgi:hypothetical protein
MRKSFSKETTMEIMMSFPSVGVDAGYTNRIVMPWNKAKWPPSAAAASVSSSATVGITMPFSAGQENAYMSECCAALEWTSTQSGGSVNLGAEVAFGQILRLPPGATNAIIYARYFVNNVDRFDKVMYTINDQSGELAQFQKTTIPTSLQTRIPARFRSVRVPVPSSESRSCSKEQQMVSRSALPRFT